MQVPPLYNLMPKLQLCQRVAPTRVDVPNDIDIEALEKAANWAKTQTCEICAGDLSKDTPDANGDDTWRYADQGPPWVAACDNQVRTADGTTLVYARHAYHVRCLQLHRRTLQQEGASPEVRCFGCQNPVVRFGKPDTLPDLDTRDPPNNEPEIPLVDRVKSMLLLFMELDNPMTRLRFSDRMVRDMEKLRRFPESILSEWAKSNNIMFDSADLLEKTKNDSEAASMVIQDGNTLQSEVVPDQPPSWSLPLIDNSSGQAAYWVMVYKVAGAYWDFVTSNGEQPHQGYEIIASEEFAGLYPELHMVLTYIGASHFWHHEIVVDVLKHWEEDLQKEENAAIRDSGEDTEHKMADLKAKRRMSFYNGTANPDTGAFVMDPLAAFLQEGQPVLYKAVRHYFEQRGEQGSMNQFRDDDAPLQPGELGYEDWGQQLYNLLREQDQDVEEIIRILEEVRGVDEGPLLTQVDGEPSSLVTMAVATGNLEVVKAVLLAMDEEHIDDMGQWVNMAGPNAIRPLHMAVEEFVMQGRSGLEIIKMLLKWHASLYATSPVPRSTTLWRTPRELAEGHAAAKSGLPTHNPGGNAQEAAKFLKEAERVLSAARPGEGMADLHDYLYTFPTKAQASQMRRASQYTETKTHFFLSARGPEEVNLHPKEFCDVVEEFWLEYMLLSGKAAPFKFQFSKTWDEMMWRFRHGPGTVDSIKHLATFLANSSEESYPLHPSMKYFNTMPALERRIKHSFTMRIAAPLPSEVEKMIRLIRQHDGASELRDMFAQGGPHEKNLANAYFRDAEMDKETPWLWTPLTYAIKIGAFEIMHMLLTEDKDFTVDANLASIASSKDQARDADTLWRPLEVALEEARTTRRMGFEAIKLLMLHGANPHFPDYKTGNTILESARQMGWSEDAVENARLVSQVERLLRAESVIRPQPDGAMMIVPNPILRTTSDEELTMQQKSPVLLEFQNSFMSVDFQGLFLRAVDEVWRRYTRNGRFDRAVVWYEILLAIKNWNPQGSAGVNYEFFVRMSIRDLFVRAGFEEREQRDFDEEDADPRFDIMAAKSRLRDKAAAEAAAQRMEVDTDALRRDERDPNPVRRRSSRE